MTINYLSRSGVRGSGASWHQTVTAGLQLGHEAQVAHGGRPRGGEDEDVLPDDGVLAVTHDHVAAERPGVGPHLLSDLHPPRLPRVALVPVVHLLQQLDRLGADHAAEVDQEPGRQLRDRQERELGHVLIGPVSGIAVGLLLRTGTANAGTLQTIH